MANREQRSNREKKKPKQNKDKKKGTAPAAPTPAQMMRSAASPGMKK